MADQAIERTTVEAPPARCLEVVLDFERYPEWAKDVKHVEVNERDGEGRGTEVTFRTAAMGRSTTYTLAYEYADDPTRVEWKLVDGDIMRQLDGAYELAPADGDADRTEVTYELTVELVIPLPNFVKNRGRSRIMHTALRELKARAETS